jgi:hypothetical protein
MENLLLFFQKYGLAITLIAIAGIAILGILKYCNLFKKIEEGKRHYIYLAISIGFSVAATIIYLLIIKRFDWTYMLIVASAIYALNQTFYNIFKVTPVNELIGKLLDFIKKLLANAGNKPPNDGE